MSLTRIGSIGINTGIAFAGVTTIVTLNSANDALSIGATVNVGSGITLGASGDIFATGVSTVTTLKVGSGVTVSSDGDIFATGVCTATSFSGSGANLTGIDTDLVSDTSPQLGGNLDVNTKNIVFGDSGGATDDRLTFGAGTDLSIYHNGSNSYIDDSGTGNLFIRSNEVRINKYTNEYMIRAIADGAVELYYDNTKRFETSSGGGTLTGDFTVTGNIYGGNHITIQDSDGASDMLKIGASEDLRIYHYNNSSYIRQHTDKPLYIGGTSTGQSLYIQPKAGEDSAIFKPNGAVELYHDNDKIFETIAAGFKAGRTSSSNSYIEIVTSGGTAGFLYGNSNNEMQVMDREGHAFLKGIKDGAVDLYYDNTKKFETTSTGVKMESSSDLNIHLLKTGSQDTLIQNTGQTEICAATGGASGQRIVFRIGANTGSMPEIARFTPDGLCFGSDTAAANALDDYEEGTWTPTAFYGSGSFSAVNNAVCRYVKVGSLVHVSGRFSLTGGGSGELRIQGLPFAKGNPSGDGNSAGIQIYVEGAASNITNDIVGLVLDASTEIYIRRSGTTSSGNDMAGKVDGGTTLLVGGTYTTFG